MGQQKLRDEIISRSTADTWQEAVGEWSLKTIWMSDEPLTCLCGHNPINEICEIKNHTNGQQTKVGNCCIKKFFQRMESGLVFDALKRVKEDISASFNPDAIRQAHQEGIINNVDRKFYIDIWRKHILSDKQWKWKESLNRRILNRWLK